MQYNIQLLLVLLVLVMMVKRIVVLVVAVITVTALSRRKGHKTRQNNRCVFLVASEKRYGLSFDRSSDQQKQVKLLFD